MYIRPLTGNKDTWIPQVEKRGTDRNTKGVRSFLSRLVTPVKVTGLAVVIGLSGDCVTWNAVSARGNGFES